jgi:hypothetical protein
MTTTISDRLIREAYHLASQADRTIPQQDEFAQLHLDIVDAGITQVVYVEAYPVKESLRFLQGNNVTVTPFEGFKARAFNRIFRQRD